MKKRFFIIGIIILAIIGAILIYNFTVGKTNKQAKTFSHEYTLLDKDNVYVYKTLDEVINILEGGTGVILFGFPECPWCQHYVVYLNEVAKANNVKQIYYYNIKEIRNNNTEKYQKIVSFLGNNLPVDDSGKGRVYVPNVVFVKNGEILANDNETSLITDGSLPSDYWTEEAITNLKNKLNVYFEKYTGACSNCN